MHKDLGISLQIQPDKKLAAERASSSPRRLGRPAAAPASHLFKRMQNENKALRSRAVQADGLYTLQTPNACSVWDKTH